MPRIEITLSDIWIKSTGRFLPSQSDPFHDEKETNELEDILDQDEEKLDEEE